MATKIREILAYQASDGTVFTNPDKAVNYQASLDAPKNKQKYILIRGYVELVSSNMNRIADKVKMLIDAQEDRDLLLVYGNTLVIPKEKLK